MQYIRCLSSSPVDTRTCWYPSLNSTLDLEIDGHEKSLVETCLPADRSVRAFVDNKLTALDLHVSQASTEQAAGVTRRRRASRNEARLVCTAHVPQPRALCPPAGSSVKSSLRRCIARSHPIPCSAML